VDVSQPLQSSEPCRPRLSRRRANDCPPPLAKPTPGPLALGKPATDVSPSMPTYLNSGYRRRPCRPPSTPSPLLSYPRQQSQGNLFFSVSLAPYNVAPRCPLAALGSWLNPMIIFAGAAIALCLRVSVRGGPTAWRLRLRFTRGYLTSPAGARDGSAHAGSNRPCRTHALVDSAA